MLPFEMRSIVHLLNVFITGSSQSRGHAEDKAGHVTGMGQTSPSHTFVRTFFFISASSSVRKLQKFLPHHAGVKSSIKGDLKIVPRVASSKLPQLQASPCTWSASARCHSSGAGKGFFFNYYFLFYFVHLWSASADRRYKYSVSTHCSVSKHRYCSMKTEYCW